MAKLTLTDITTNRLTSITAYNNNNDAIEAAMENTLSRDGTSPNQMAADLDMNGNSILNYTVIITFENETATNIADVSNAINTTNKAQGRAVWDSTNNKLKVATGSATTDTWVDADGTNAVTPS